MQNKIVKIMFIVIFIMLVVVSFCITLYDEKKYNDRKERVSNIVLTYLEDKYNEEFKVKDYSVEKNTYNHYVEDDYITTEMDSSYIYIFEVLSSRLIDFSVMYVEYENDEYDKYAKYNILREGIYENYIYEYKIKDIRREIKDNLNKYIDNINSFSVKIDDLSIDNTNYIYSYSLDDNDSLEAFKNYTHMDKTISNKDFYNNCLKVSDNSKLYLDIDVENIIDESNIDKLNKRVIKLVNYLYDLGYKEYDINFIFNNYTSARATPYNDGKKIYFIFDYESYSDIDDDNKLGLYVLDR